MRAAARPRRGGVVMYSLGADFMAPYWEPEVDVLVRVPLGGDWQRAIMVHREAHRDAVAFAYAMNTSPWNPTIREAAQVCRGWGIPTVWHTIEDPNSLYTFIGQAAGFDIIATTDAECIPQYRERYPGAKVLWLPLACQPTMHYPQPLVEGAVDFVLIANWYDGPVRQWAVDTVVKPFLQRGHSLALYAYERDAWPVLYQASWRARTSCYDVAKFYPQGRVALAMNNQRLGTAMTSMRTYEVLACGKPMLAAHSDAYERLGFVNAWPGLAMDEPVRQRAEAVMDALGTGHFMWVDRPSESYLAGRYLLENLGAATAMAQRGRAFVLANHTYAHRLRTLLEAL